MALNTNLAVATLSHRPPLSYGSWQLGICYCTQEHHLGDVCPPHLRALMGWFFTWGHHECPPDVDITALHICIHVKVPGVLMVF